MGLPMKLFETFWVRMLLAGVVAAFAVLFVLGAILRYYDERNDRGDDAVTNAFVVDVVDLRERPDLAEAIRRERERYEEPEEKLPQPPPLPERQITGFVQLEYTIEPDGTVSNVRVIGAAPSGVYEERAIAEASRRMHAPVYNDAGEPVARRTTEIIEFSVPASELRSSQ